LKAIAIALALLDFAPVFFLSLGLFFLAQLVDRLDHRCRRMAFAGFILVGLGGLFRAASNLALAVSGEEIPLLAASLWVFAGPGFTLMAAALIRGRATSQGKVISRDPWIVPTALWWMVLLTALYLNTVAGPGRDGRLLLVGLAFVGSAATGITGAALGWSRQLHMAAGLFAFNICATATCIALRALAPQLLLIQVFGELLHLAAQAAFAFAAWRIAAEYHARVGPTATTT
jgi:hypothetical protein